MSEGRAGALRLHLVGVLLLGLLALLLLTFGLARAQETKETETKKPWTGKLADGRVITKADLDQILQAHSLWLKSEGKEGQRADLSGARLEKAELSRASFYKANLPRANLSGAKLLVAWMKGAYLYDTNLSGAELFVATLSGAWFQPKPGTVSDVSLLLSINGLESLQYANSSHGLVELRETYKKAGLREPERQVTYALNHTRREKLWQEGGLLGKLESLFNLVCFEWPCQYGMNPGRPLEILGLGLFLFTPLYLLALRRRHRETGIWLVCCPRTALSAGA